MGIIMENLELDMPLKNKKIAIMQPTFNPWLGYFCMIDYVDQFVFLDDVQLTKRSWQVRNKIKTQNGELFLTIPVKKTLTRDELIIKNAMINHDLKWNKKHLSSIKHSYSSSNYYDEIISFVEEHYNKMHESLANFNQELIKNICYQIGIETNFINSSDLEAKDLKKDDKLVKICTVLEGNEYYSALGSKNYIRPELFSSNNLKLNYQNYQHPKYDQIHGDFLPYMGILDLLFNVGFEKSLEIIRQGSDEYRT